MDISQLSLMELKALERQIPREIRRRSAEEKGNVRRKLEKLAQESGFTLSELMDGGRRVAAVKGPKGVAKYRHPQLANLSWSGRGRKPGWLEKWLAEGGKLEQLAV
ncbi:MAG: H-NS histone family protein [Zoogloeaceae bacterium]|jgi:DNA-binding protein H-NS|nr:H-NS histone family protein [Zoogloeaceae bacterium]